MTDTQHIASVVNDYRAAFTWAARCSCGWEEFYSLAVVADRAAEEHMRTMIEAVEMLPTQGHCARCCLGYSEHPPDADRCMTCGEPVPCPEDDGPPVITSEGRWHADCGDRPFGG